MATVKAEHRPSDAAGCAVVLTDVRDLVARAIAEAGPYARFTLVPPSAKPAPPSTSPSAVGRHVALATYDVPPFGSKSIRIEFWPEHRRVRPFCSGCLSGSCGHALRVGAAFRAAIAGELAPLTRHVRSDAQDGLSDDDLARIWREREAAREASARAARLAAEHAARSAAEAQAAEDHAAEIARCARGGDLPLFAST